MHNTTSALKLKEYFDRWGGKIARENPAFCCEMYILYRIGKVYCDISKLLLPTQELQNPNMNENSYRFLPL